jgi:hypothetical protein
MQKMLRMVSQQDWDLFKLPDAARRQRLLCPPSGEYLLTSLITEAAHAAEHGEICLDWEKALDKPGYFRLRTQIPVTEGTFDLLFNGRSGYRAQYYLSPEEGIVYNRQIIDGLIPAINSAYDRNPLRDIPFDLIECSLRTPHAKIWVFEKPGYNPFNKAAENTLNPARWVQNNKACLGRRCPLPNCLQIDLKGSFIDLQKTDFFVGAGKENRACDLYCNGYT